MRRIPNTQSLFSATKVWTWLKSSGPDQMADSRRLWGVDRFDVMQIHNMLNWDGHLETLLEDKAQDRIRYIGITTSHAGGRHRRTGPDRLEETAANTRVTRPQPGASGRSAFGYERTF